MVPFIDTKEFKELNVGLALDEGFFLSIFISRPLVSNQNVFIFRSS